MFESLQGRPRRAARAAWASRSRPRCSASPARWCSASSICRPSQAQNRFYTELEDWLSTTVRDLGVEPMRRRPCGSAPLSGDMQAAIERLREAIAESRSSKAATTAMANLAEAIQGLVQHMRTEQQMIRDWVDAQAEQHREIRTPAGNAGAREREQADVRQRHGARTRPPRRAASITGRASSTRCRRCCSASSSCCRCSCVVQFYPVAGSDRQGHRAAAASTRRSRSSPTCWRWRRPASSDLEEQLAQLARQPRRHRRRARPLAAASTKAPAAAPRAQGKAERARRPARSRKAA